jgi:hypothetical protein
MAVERKMCPLIDLSCEMEQCEWWNNQFGMCSIKVIGKMLERISEKQVL